MTQSQEHELHVLNELIAATLTSVDNYHEVAATIDSRYAVVFMQHASIRQYIVEQLQAQVRNLGGKPAHSRSILAAAHRVALDGDDSDDRDRNALGSALERGEEHLSRQFEAALKSDGLSESSLELLEKGYRLLKAGRDHAWDLLKHHVDDHSFPIESRPHRADARALHKYSPL